MKLALLLLSYPVTFLVLLWLDDQWIRYRNKRAIARKAWLKKLMDE